MIKLAGTLKHPAILQIRKDEGISPEIEKKILMILSRSPGEFETEKVRTGLDIYFSDVNDARKSVSDLKKHFNFKVKMSTKYAGLRKGRVRTLFVYSLRINENERK